MLSCEIHSQLKPTEHQEMWLECPFSAPKYKKPKWKFKSSDDVGKPLMSEPQRVRHSNDTHQRVCRST